MFNNYCFNLASQQVAYSAKEKERRNPMPCNCVTDQRQIARHGQDVWTSI